MIKLKHYIFAFLRFALAILSFAVSLLALFKAPTNDLWILAIVVTEYGHYLFLVPLLVFLPGWRRGNSQQLPNFDKYFAAHGYVVAAINYRLAPDWKFPAAVEDVNSAIAYLKNHARELNLDPQRIVLLGRSAGAQLALLAAYTADDAAIRGVVSFYGPADLYYGYTHPANPRVINSQLVLEEFLGGSPEAVPEVYEAASPIHFISNSSPPTLLIHGGRDELVSPIQSRKAATALQENGVPHYYLHLPWATHACDASLSGPSGQLSLYAIERFLAVVMR